MIVYQEETVTKRGADSFDTLDYYGSVTKVDSEILKKGLNHIYDSETGFYKILFVINNTVYVGAPTNYSNGTLARVVGTDTVQTLKVTEQLELV